MPKIQSEPRACKGSKGAERRRPGRFKPMFTARLMRKMAGELGRGLVARWPAEADPCPGAEALGLAYLMGKQTGTSLAEVLDEVAAHPREAARSLARWMEPEVEATDRPEEENDVP